MYDTLRIILGTYLFYLRNKNVMMHNNYYEVYAFQFHTIELKIQF